MSEPVVVFQAEPTPGVYLAVGDYPDAPHRRVVLLQGDAVMLTATPEGFARLAESAAVVAEVARQVPATVWPDLAPSSTDVVVAEIAEGSSGA